MSEYLAENNFAIPEPTPPPTLTYAHEPPYENGEKKEINEPEVRAVVDFFASVHDFNRQFGFVPTFAKTLVESETLSGNVLWGENLHKPTLTDVNGFLSQLSLTNLSPRDSRIVSERIRDILLNHPVFWRFISGRNYDLIVDGAPGESSEVCGWKRNSVHLQGVTNREDFICIWDNSGTGFHEKEELLVELFKHELNHTFLGNPANIAPYLNKELYLQMQTELLEWQADYFEIIRTNGHEILLSDSDLTFYQEFQVLADVLGMTSDNLERTPVTYDMLKKHSALQAFEALLAHAALTPSRMQIVPIVMGSGSSNSSQEFRPLGLSSYLAGVTQILEKYHNESRMHQSNEELNDSSKNRAHLKSPVTDSRNRIRTLYRTNNSDWQSFVAKASLNRLNQ